MPLSYLPQYISLYVLGIVASRRNWFFTLTSRVAKELAADVSTVYLIHPVVLVGFAYAFSVVALYPLLKWGIAVLITIPLCFLISSGIRRIPLVNRVV